MSTTSDDMKKWMDDTDNDIDALAVHVLALEQKLLPTRGPVASVSYTDSKGNSVTAATRGLAGRKC
jgi:hypothetical protein